MEKEASSRGLGMVCAFNHRHDPGDICSPAQCEAARLHRGLIGNVEIEDWALYVIGESTEHEYLNQECPEGWVTPPVVPENPFYYRVTTD